MRRRTGRAIAAVAIGFCITVVVLAGLGSGVSANPVACVAPGGASGCFSSVQDALDSSAEGTSIYVLQGSYTENIVISKTVLLLGGCDNTLCMPNTPGASTLDGSSSSAPVIRVVNGANPVIDGFTITGGDGTSNDGRGGGIAVREAAATIRNNTIHHNVASSDVRVIGQGGGIGVFTTTVPVLIENNMIMDNIGYSPVLTSTNVARYGAGGGIRIMDGQVSVVSNQFRRNTAARTDIPSTQATGHGGGISLEDVQTALISGNHFQHNIALDTGYWGFGGALEVDTTAVLTVTNNTLISNTAVISGYSGGGGGIFILHTKSANTRNIIQNNDIFDNIGIVQAHTSPNYNGGIFANGGGIYTYGKLDTNASVWIEDNTIRGNIAAKQMTVTGNGMSGHASGGGIHIIEAGTVNIIDNEVTANIAVEQAAVENTGGWTGVQSGGGIAVFGSRTVTVSENLIGNNTIVVQHDIVESSVGASGGGLKLGWVGEALVSDNIISDNVSVQQGSFTSDNGLPYNISGAGLSIAADSSHVRVIENELTGNTNARTVASQGTTSRIWPPGAAVDIWEDASNAAASLVEMERNYIADNMAHLAGDGNPAVSVIQSRLHSTNDIVVNNDEGGYLASGDGTPAQLRLTNVTVANNDILGFQLEGVQLDASVTNSIISGHDRGFWLRNGASSPTNDYNLHNNIINIDGALTMGSHSIIGYAPGFVDPSNGNYRLRPDSPAVDAGTNVNAPAEDFEGDSRPLDGNDDGQAVVDMGADEYRAPEPIVFKCEDAQGILLTDCEALVALFNSTGGMNWTNRSGWLTTDTPCTWHGVSCSGNRVSGIHLSSNRLAGQLPPEIGDLTEIISFNVNDNQLAGPIPTTIGQLTKLRYMHWDQNGLSGPIPTEIGNLTALRELWFSYNQLSGAVPSSLWNLTSLEELSLRDNDVTGPIPAALGDLDQLAYLDLDSNEFDGPLPGEIGNLASLRTLDLSGNDLSGMLPASMSQLTRLRKFDVRDNEFVGAIPDLSAATDLLDLQFSDNRFEGPLPTWIGSLTTLREIDMDTNPLTGPLPANFMALTALEILEFENTMLCVPQDAAFQTWLSGVDAVESNDISCDGPQPGAIAGVITDKANGNVLDDVEICAWTFEKSQWSGCARTSSDGYYILTGLTAGQYRVRTLHRGHAPYYYDDVSWWVEATPLTVEAGEIAAMDAAMRAGGIVEGYIYSAEDNRPLGDVSVKAGIGGHAVCTEDDGSFTLFAPYGKHLVYAPDGFCENDIYIREWWQESASQADAMPVELSDANPLVDNLRFTLEEGASIAGTVLGSNDGGPLRPVEDAQVCYWRYHASGGRTSDWRGCTHAKEDGSYRINGLRPGEYGLRAKMEGYGHAFYGNAFDEAGSTRITLRGGDASQDINFELGPGGVIEGTVYSGDGKTALKDIGYELNDGKLGGCTDSNGRFRVPLAYGSYTVHVGHNFCGIDSYAIEWWQDASSYDDRTEIVLNAANPLRSDIDFTLDRLASVEIDEIDSETVLEIATGDEATTITIPPNAVAEPIKLVYRETDADAPPSGFQLAGLAFDLSAFRDGQRLENYSFQKPIVIEIEYSDVDIAGLDEATLTLNYWDPKTETWQDAACGPYDRRPHENKLAASVCHLTTFGVVGEEFASENRLHLPVIFGQ